MNNTQTLKQDMKDLALALMGDVQEAYDGGNPVEVYNALNRLKVGAESLKLLAETAEVLDYPDTPFNK